MPPRLPQDVRDCIDLTAISDLKKSELTQTNRHRSPEEISELIRLIKIKCPGPVNDLTRFGNDAEIHRRIRQSLVSKKKQKRKSKKVGSVGKHTARAVSPRQDPASTRIGLPSVPVDSAPLSSGASLDHFMENQHLDI